MTNTSQNTSLKTERGKIHLSLLVCPYELMS